MADKRVDTFHFSAADIHPAVRRKTPQIMSVFGVTFSGKTFGALMLAAGLVEPGEKIAFVDTENGRGTMYADDPDIRAAVPKESWVDGSPYAVININPPFHPAKYVAAYRAIQEYGATVTITDSGSHAWSEEGGALDMKEEDKSWVEAKKWTKRFKSSILYSPMHHIVCLRAQEKTKVITVNGKQTYVPLGIMPICEKSFPYDLGLAFSVEGEVDGKPATHFATPVKWPKAMNPLFNGWKPQLLTPEVGKRIREWNNSGIGDDLAERLKHQSRLVADEGLSAYEKYFKSLSPYQRKILVDSGAHAENKKTAEEADKPSLDPDSDEAIRQQNAAILAQEKEHQNA